MKTSHLRIGLVAATVTASILTFAGSAFAWHANVFGNTDCVDSAGNSVINWDVQYPAEDWAVGPMSFTTSHPVTFNRTTLNPGEEAQASELVHWTKNTYTLTITETFVQSPEPPHKDFKTIHRPDACLPPAPSTTGPEIPCVLGPDGHYNFSGTNIPCEGPAPTTTTIVPVLAVDVPVVPTTTTTSVAAPTPPAALSGGLPQTGEKETLATWAFVLVLVGGAACLVAVRRRRAAR